MEPSNIMGAPFEHFKVSFTMTCKWPVYVVFMAVFKLLVKHA